MYKKALGIIAGAILASQSLVAYAAIGEYSELPSCDAPEFSSNGCNQCFDGGKIKVGEKLIELFDTWTNTNPTDQIIYRDEQSMPELINLGGEKTKWSSVPDDTMKFWKFANEIVWTDSKVTSTTSTGSTGTGTKADLGIPKQEFLLEANKKIRFLESDLNAVHTLEATDKQDGDSLGILKFTLAYHDLTNDGNESGLKNHVECVRYQAAGTPVKPPVTPTTVTKVKTGPESAIIILAALGIAYGIIRLRKRA